MSTFILTWNPTKWDYPDGVYEREVAKTAAGQAIDDRWSVGGRRGDISEGDRAFLLRQGPERRGIVASGHFKGGVYEDEHWDGSGRMANYAEVSFEVVLDAGDRLQTEDLLAEVPGVSWNNLMQSGIRVEPAAAADLEELWSDHLDSLGFRSPEEVPEDEAFHEGAVEKVLVNRYERNRKAREKCIERWGTACFVCGFDFEARYGKIGARFIHVHHLIEISEVGEEYEVDPEADLRPVCPNCHAMLHRRKPALSPAQLKRRLRPTAP